MDNEFGSYIGFVWAAYAVAGIILGGITVSSVCKFLKLKKMEKDASS
ncbi:MAG TPA: heme exporter protein CcmD [Alphaproteobacteria bacterium]|jgi:heme exporter protein D